jgi:hypothetical protein
MRDLPHVKLFPSDLIDDMHEAFEAVCATLRLTPQSDKATALVITKIVELANAGRRGTDLATETLRFFETSEPSAAPVRLRPHRSFKYGRAGTIHVAEGCQRSPAAPLQASVTERPIALPPD